MGSFDFLNFSIDKNEDGYISLLSFQILDRRDLELIINEFEKETDIKDWKK